MSTARCLEAFPRVTELVLLHNRCHVVAVTEHLDVFMRPRFIKSCGTWQNSAKPRSTADFSQRLPHWNCDSFHTWCCLATVIKTAMLRFTDNTEMVQIGNVTFLFLYYSYSFESVIIMESQAGRQAYYTKGSTGIANWLLIHVLNTMFCVVGRDHITAITFSSGSQYAYRFCVYFSPWEKPRAAAWR